MDRRDIFELLDETAGIDTRTASALTNIIWSLRYELAKRMYNKYRDEWRARKCGASMTFDIWLNQQE